MLRVLVILAAFFLCGLPAQARSLEEFAVGNWDAGAYTYENSDRFSHCAASVPYQHGIDMLVQIADNYTWTLGFLSSSWPQKPGEVVALRLRFDGGSWIDIDRALASPGIIEVPMPVDSVLIGRFMRGLGMDMRIAGSSKTYSFALTGTHSLMTRLVECVDHYLALERSKAPTETAAAEASQPAAAPADSQPKVYSGTGIVISKEGHIVTNAHVVEGCQEVAVRRSGDAAQTAQVVVDDKANDLALLKAPADALGTDVASLRSGRSAPAGERVAVYGFPLAGALSSTGNIVEGNITSAAGLGDDINHFQISAPIQPGNSGGPLLDFGGGVIGVINAKLNDLAFAGETGSLPQNVNFAIKKSVLENFLDAHGIAYVEEPRGTELTLVEIAGRAKKFTVLLVCTAQ